eukprot:COSAG04_NODE_18171_length_449_cov_0.888571_1_plen_25_part_10
MKILKKRSRIGKDEDNAAGVRRPEK